MALEKFDLATLAGMDGGRIHEAPGVKTARKVTLIVSLEPVADEEVTVARRSLLSVLAVLLATLHRQAERRQGEAVKMLRLELHGGSVGHVIQALSRIDFSRTSGGRTDVAHGRESLGRSVEASVQQADKVPEQLRKVMELQQPRGMQPKGVNVEFGLYLDLEAQNVELHVLADEVERARNLALAAVVQDLIAALPGVPVFQGVP